MYIRQEGKQICSPRYSTSSSAGQKSSDSDEASVQDGDVAVTGMLLMVPRESRSVRKFVESDPLESQAVARRVGASSHHAIAGL